MNTQEKIIPADQIQALKIDENAHENPYLDPAFAKALEKDILEKGQIDPVIMFDGMIMDGRNRINAISALKKDLKVLELTDCSYEEAVEYARSKNDHRRHMDTSQLAMRAAYEILKSRVNEDGTTKPRPQWLQVKDHRDVESKKISDSTVEKAIRLAKSHPDYAQQIFVGKHTLQQVDTILKKQEKKLEEAQADIEGLQTRLDQDPFYYENGDIKPKTLVYTDKNESYLGSHYSEDAAARYSAYTKQLSKEELAIKLVELEEELAELRQEK